MASSNQDDAVGRLRVSKTAKDRRFEELSATIEQMKNAMQSNYWVCLHEIFGKINRQVEKLMRLTESYTPPNSYIKALVMLEGYLNHQAAANNKGKTRSCSKAKALHAMRQKLIKKYIQYEDLINKWREENSEEEEDDDDDENQPPTMIVSLDDILLCHVLPRVPAKSIVRFKCVSKGWYSFLSTPMFARMHQSHHQNHHKLLFISTNYNATTSPAAFSTIDCEAPEDGFTSTRRLPFKLGRPQSVSVITSLNGLACLGIINRRKRTQNEEYSRLILWNPLTGDYKTLPKTNACKECYEVDGRAFVLYYISSQDDYKLLRVTNSCNVYIYSLRSDLWRKIEPTEDFHRLSRSFSNHSASLNGKLYVLKEDEADAYSIITLDPETDKFTEAATPFFRGAFTTCSGFTVLRGFIHVWMRKLMGEYRHIDLWRMDGDGDWTKLETLYETPSFPDWMFMQPLHLMADGKWLMCCDGEECLYKTDPEKPADELFWSYTTTVYSEDGTGTGTRTRTSSNEVRRHC